jgi:hypothetical protein
MKVWGHTTSRGGDIQHSRGRDTQRQGVGTYNSQGVGVRGSPVRGCSYDDLSGRRRSQAFDKVIVLHV